MCSSISSRQKDLSKIEVYIIRLTAFYEFRLSNGCSLPFFNLDVIHIQT